MRRTETVSVPIELPGATVPPAKLLVSHTVPMPWNRPSESTFTSPHGLPRAHPNRGRAGETGAVTGKHHRAIAVLGEAAACAGEGTGQRQRRACVGKQGSLPQHVDGPAGRETGGRVKRDPGEVQAAARGIEIGVGGDLQRALPDLAAAGVGVDAAD